MQWLPEEFLPYLEHWKSSVQKRAGYSDKEKNIMLIAKETHNGIIVTGEVFVNFHMYMFIS